MERSGVVVSLIVAVTLVAVAGHGSAMSATPRLRTVHLPVEAAIDGSHSFLRGRISYTIPGAWADDPHSPFGDRSNGRYRTTFADGCLLQVIVWVHARATPASAARQVEDALIVGARKANLGRGSRPGGAWGVDREKDAPSANRKFVEGVAPVHIHGHVYGQVRAGFPMTGSSCSDADVFVAARHAQRIVRESKVDLRVARG
jgi:hypothetical protein